MERVVVFMGMILFLFPLFEKECARTFDKWNSRAYDKHAEVEPYAP